MIHSIENGQALVLGIIQGLTEFLPVSSSAHLVIFQKLLGIKEHNIPFDVAVHFGTLLSVLTFYRNAIYKVIVDLSGWLTHRRSTAATQLFLYVCLASVPTAIIGLSFKDWFEQAFNNLSAVGVFLLITGGLLFIVRKSGEPSSRSDFWNIADDPQLRWKSAFGIGVVQGLAIAPGISRSGSTISAGLMFGLRPQTATLFSFMLAVPAILGAGIIELRAISFNGVALLPFCVGILASYISGLLGLALIIKLIRFKRLEWFSYYLWTIGVAVIAWEFRG